MVNNPFFDLYLDEAADFSAYLVLENIEVDDVTGKETITQVDLTDIASISSQVRQDFSDASPIIFTFDAAVTSALKGEIGISVSKLNTTDLYNGPLPTYQIGYYDILLTSTSGVTHKLVSGKVFLNQTVTR